MDEIGVLDDPRAAAVALDPLRSRLLALLAGDAASAATLAAAVDQTRQKVGYHLRLLAEHDLVREVGQRRHGGLTERLFTASAGAYVVSPGALGAAGADPDRVEDRLSAEYLIALAGRAVREVGLLVRGAAAARQRLPTLSIDTDIRFGTAADRDAFALEVAATVRDLASRYHDESSTGGRWYRFVAVSHPRPSEEP